MYESPIHITELADNIFKQISDAKEAYIMAEVKMVVDVDKDELIKALSYDRDQYYNGYADRDNEIVRCKDCEYGVDWDGRLGCEWHGFYRTEPNWFCADGERREE